MPSLFLSRPGLPVFLPDVISVSDFIVFFEVPRLALICSRRLQFRLFCICIFCIWFLIIEVIIVGLDFNFTAGGFRQVRQYFSLLHLDVCECLKYL